jgi:acetyl/propionyl-CoA carboxylase alpha subunit
MRRVLIANRGEIARRIARTCRAMSIETVAVYSEADRQALHVAEADDAVLIGPAAPAESYLHIDRILTAARATGADAVHPGYGFLSEHADFAEACAQAGLVFIGPPADVLRHTGSKTAARETAARAGVPVVPGDTPGSQDDAAIAAAAARVGFPLLLKAAGGGGGKGMRRVAGAGELMQAIGAARREAQHAFGRTDLYVEREIRRPRHVEVQIFGDGHGQVVHLFERDCTLQRRHQKVIEETPAPTITPAVRERLLAAACRVATAVGYVNAGTVEFLVEGAGDGAAFYFLEMNTRLQVEHPVTEAVTGLDLVRLQLLVADGQPLPFVQADVHSTGHAIECRIYAEDSRHLLPQSGRVLAYREPQGSGIRIDSGIAAGQIVTADYDPLLAKVTAHGTTRAEAHALLLRAVRQFEILGLRHNIGFLRRTLERPEVAASATWTTFIEEHLDALTAPPGDAMVRAAAAAAAWTVSRASDAAPSASPIAADPWDILGRVDW